MERCVLLTQFGNVDFSTAGTASDRPVEGAPSAGPILVSKDYKSLLIIHGLLMFLAWGVAPFIAIFIARFLKHIGHTWYLLHMGIFALITGGGSLAGFLLVYLYKTPPHFEGFHRTLGLVVFIITFLQITLGFVIDKLYAPGRKSIPWWDQMHWWVGRALFLAGIVNIFTGLKQYEEKYAMSIGWYIGYATWLAVGFGLMVLGQWRYGISSLSRQRATQD